MNNLNNNTDSVKYALISVSNKDNLDIITNYLIKNNYSIISTGGTYKAIREILNNNSLNNYLNKVIEISEVTEYPELLGGRVKTLHPKIANRNISRLF